MKKTNHSSFVVLKMIQAKPMFFLDGDLSIKRIRSFIVGYECGLAEVGASADDSVTLRDFNDWVADKLEFGESTSGWCNMILTRTESDREAYDRFFELLDQFLKEHPTQAPDAGEK